jgi:prolyl-tRNA synthetase
MKVIDLLLKTRREVGKEVESINADLLTRANYIDQVAAGVYTYLPLGLKVLEKIENIIRDEMIKAGGQEVLMPVLHPKENWEKTGRWETLDDLFRFTSYYSKTDLALGPTHEEIVVPLAKRYIQSYRDLPKYIFQIQDIRMIRVRESDERSTPVGCYTGPLLIILYKIADRLPDNFFHGSSVPSL